MIEKALENIRPSSLWVLTGSSYNSLEWLDTVQTKPTQQELETEVARLQAEYEDKEYQRQRAVAYPSIQDQLDTLYHGGYEAWKATITAVKEEFQKP
jgi:phosphoglycolate phosphatase-like HAD superfamily hydrolase